MTSSNWIHIEKIACSVTVLMMTGIGCILMSPTIRTMVSASCLFATSVLSMNVNVGNP